MQVNLSRNSWHRKLQSYVLHNDDDFQNLCPYFWLTIFSLFAVPFVFLVKGPISWAAEALCVVIEKLVDWILVPFSEYVCKPLDALFVESYIKKLTAEEVVRLYERRWKNGKRPKVFERWMAAFGDKAHFMLDQYIKEVQAARDAYEAKMRAKEAAAYLADLEAEKNRKAFLLKLASTTQFVAPFLLAAVTAAVFYGIYWGTKAWFNLWIIDWDEVWQVAIAALEIAGIVLVLIAIAFLVIVFLDEFGKKVLSKCWLFATFPFRLRLVKKSAGFAFRPIVWIARKSVGAIVVTFDLLFQYIKATKEGYCPKIEWKE